MSQPRRTLNSVAKAILFEGVVLLAFLAFAALGLIFDSQIGFRPVVPYNYLGIILVLAGLFLRFWGSFTIFGRGKGTPLPSRPPSVLLTSGPYRFIRNPLYLGAFLLYLGVLITVTTILLAIMGLLAWPITVVMISREEREALKKSSANPTGNTKIGLLDGSREIKGRVIRLARLEGTRRPARDYFFRFHSNAWRRFLLGS